MFISTTSPILLSVFNFVFKCFWFYIIIIIIIIIIGIITIIIVTIISEYFLEFFLIDFMNTCLCSFF